MSPRTASHPPAAPADRAAAERRLIEIAAAVAARREALHEEAAALSLLVDWDRLAAALAWRRLLPPLGPRLLALSDGVAGPEFEAAVEAAVETARRQAVLLSSVGDLAGLALAAAGVRSAPLKGPGLAEAIYGDPGRRLAGDVDLLVDVSDLPAAVAVVEGLGYSAPVDPRDVNGLPELHFALPHREGRMPPVELHWRIHWYERRFASARLLPPAGAGAGWRPAAADELAALLLFYARDGFVDLRLAADLGAWWDARGAELAPAALEEVAVAHPELDRALRISARVAARTVGLPAAEQIDPRPELRARLAVELANPHPRRGEVQTYAEIGLVDGLLTPRGGGGALLRRQLLVPDEVLRRRDQLTGKGRRGPFRVGTRLGYAVRLLVRAGVLGFYLLALGRAFCAARARKARRAS
ncbi:MAG TPA: nucleotidyltransferase family protein [Solirubrobacterales bacterium]|jgi:hypothetical protein